MKAVVNAKRVKEAIIELFRSTKAEVSEYLADNRENYSNFSIVADFWTCKVTHNKFLGIRVYLIDKEWKFNSILLGTKEFDPIYSDRVGGIGKPFRMWLTKMLESFGLTISDFYGTTSDSGGDVKRMLRSELKLNWEWSFAHMAHAATKASCGVGGKKARAANPEMAELITKMTLVITQVKLVSSAGKLFAELCKAKTKGASTRLSEDDKHFKTASPPNFPLSPHLTDVIHVLSILTAVADIKFKCQAERAEQVEVLMALYRTRIDDLAPEKPILHYLSTVDKPQWISASSLTPLAAKTRDLLRDAIDERFCSRYYDDSKFDSCDLALEMMLKLHPIYKDTQEYHNRVVVMCSRQHGKTSKEAVERLKDVTNKIRSNLLVLLKAVAGPRETVEEQPIASRANLSRLEARFVPHAARPVIASHVDRKEEAELDRWLDDPIGVLGNDDMTPNESVFEFWQRLEQSGEYRLIPKAVRILFSIPSSSYQLKRDFSVSGEMVSPQRSSLAGENIDMCIFLNRNSEFVNLLQCEEINRGQHQQCVPPGIGFDLDPYIFMDDIDSSILAEFVSKIEGEREDGHPRTVRLPACRAGADVAERVFYLASVAREDPADNAKDTHDDENGSAVAVARRHTVADHADYGAEDDAHHGPNHDVSCTA
ncbi:unnamed protein product [Phytophthora fragariaefolia]|uniref:Unnamed protein product n=1 Tax=Phytophthora fragariaefolia TaxID=1490495 RepID=A0A9W6TY42_9STRA|nr:unnamed protein product [Phytophthora fragariaefolia]